MLNLDSGRTWIFSYAILDHAKNPLDVTDWEIRAEISDGEKSLKKANHLVAGGSNTQIKVLDTEGNIQVVFNPEETIQLGFKTYNFEIVVRSTADINGVRHTFTVVKEQITPVKSLITLD